MLETRVPGGGSGQDLPVTSRPLESSAQGGRCGGVKTFTGASTQTRSPNVQGKHLADVTLACANVWSLSPQVLTGAINTIQSFLAGSAQEVVELEGGDPEPGDLFLFGLMSPTARWCPRGHVLWPRTDYPFQGKRLWLKQALVCEKGCPPKPRCTSGRATREG